MIRRALSIFRKVLLVMLTLAAVGTLTARAFTHQPERAGGWSFRSSPWLGNRVVVHNRYIVFAHDKVLPGQVPDPEFGVRVSEALREAEEAGKLAPSNGIMEDSFAGSSLLGVRWGRGQYRAEFGLLTDCYVIHVPLWMPLVAFGAYPTVAFIRGPLRRWRRRRKGLCVNCGYNLTGNVTGVCSECGVEI